MLIESECGVHDDNETRDLLRKLDLSIRNIDGWYCRKCMQPPCAKKNGFGLTWVQSEARER